MENDVNYENIDSMNLILEIAKLLDDKERKSNVDTLMSQKTSRLIISLLAIHETLTQNQIVKITHMRPSTVSLCISELEKEGYIKKYKSGTDARAYNLYLTLKGYKVFENAKKQQSEERTNLLKGLSPKEERELSYYLNIIKNNLLKK